MYSVDLKERVIRYRIEEKHTIKQTSETYKISEITIRRWSKIYKETGCIRSEYDSSKRKYKKINPEKLKKYITENKDKFLKEIAKEFSCSISGIKKAMNKLKITRKKNKMLQRER